MAVLSRQSTITAVLPLMAEFTVRNVWRLVRIWTIVLLANLSGTLFAAIFWGSAPVLTPELRAGMLEISRHLLDQDCAGAFFKAIAAGFLMAATVWLLPNAGGVQLHVVILMTYLIAAGGFLHIVAGSVEAFLLVLTGVSSLGTMASFFIAPVLLGNIVGGTALFALLAYAQVMKEIQPPKDDSDTPHSRRGVRNGGLK
jgi:formate/nitrite transporter FocA (FNT family)